MGGLGEAEAAVGGHGFHVVGHAVQHRAHAHLDAGRRNLGEHRRAVGLGEDRLGQIRAHLALVDVVGAHHLDVGGIVAAQVPMHQAHGVVVGPPVIGDALDKRTGAVANSDNRDANLAHELFLA